MTGANLKALRIRLGLSVIQFGRLLGYEGYDATVSRDIRRYENTREVLPPGLRARVSTLAFRQGDLLDALAKPRPRMAP